MTHIVLIVDNDAPTRAALSRILADHYLITAVPSPEDAMLAMTESMPDAMLIDIRIYDPADENGLALALRVRGSLGKFAPTIVMMTTSQRLATDARREGFRVVMKPFGMHEILAAIVAEMESE